MSRADTFSGLQLRISAKRLGVIVTLIGTAVASYFTMSTKQNIDIEKRLSNIESKIEMLMPYRVSTK